jgi:hypothetical protein
VEGRALSPKRGKERASLRLGLEYSLQPAELGGEQGPWWTESCIAQCCEGRSQHAHSALAPVNAAPSPLLAFVALDPILFFVMETSPPKSRGRGGLSAWAWHSRDSSAGGTDQLGGVHATKLLGPVRRGISREIATLAVMFLPAPSAKRPRATGLPARQPASPPALRTSKCSTIIALIRLWLIERGIGGR